MLNKFTAYLTGVIFLMLLSLDVISQSLVPKQVTIIDNLPRTYTLGRKTLGKTSSCPVDTVRYPYYKATTLLAVALNNTTSGNRFAQYFEAVQPTTVSGFDFYCWQSAGTNAVVVVDCKLYLANPMDSTPMGSALASVSVSIDSTFGGGQLTTLIKRAIFANAPTVSVPYVLTVETNSTTSVSVVCNGYNTSPPNGRSEWLSSIHFGNNSWYNRSYSVNVGGIQFNADFIYHPYISYSLTADFTPSSLCNQGGNQIVFTNTSSPALNNKFYNTRAFYNITFASCMWDYGDSSGTWYALNGTRTYNYRIPYNVTLKDTILGWSTGCGDSKTIPLSASPPPVQAKSNSPICIGSTLKLYADTLAGATGYYWTGPNGFTSSIQNPTISSAGVIHQGTYSVRAVMGQCTSAVAITLVNIQPTPQIISNSPVCIGQTLSLSVSAIANGIYSWTGPNGFTSSIQSPNINNVTMADSGLYQVSIVSPGCGQMGPYSVRASINPIPSAPTASNNGPICSGDTLKLIASGISGDFNWTGPNGFTANQQNITRISAPVSMSGTYSVTVVVNGCKSLPATTTVSISNTPTVPVVSNNGPLCPGQTLVLTATSVSGVSYSWTGPNGFTSSIQNPTRSNITLSDSGNYAVTATINGCSSAAATTKLFTSSTTKSPVASSNGPLCPGQSLNLTASTVPGASYSWTGPNNFSSTLQNPIISSVSLADSGIYSVTATTTGCGASSPSSTKAVVNTLPDPPLLSNSGPVCQGDSIVLNASNVTGAIYYWSGPAGFASNQQNPVIKNMGLNKTGVYSVYVEVTGCGVSASNSISVRLYPVPQTPTISGITSLCEGDSLKLTGNVIGAGNNVQYNWSGPIGYNSQAKNILLGNVSALQTGSYSLYVVDSGCASSVAATSVNVRVRPATPLASNNGPVCAGNDIQLNASTVTGSVYKWTGPNGFLSSSQNPIVPGFGPYGSGTYSVIAYLNGCNSIPGTTNVQLYPLPPTPVATNDGPRCVGNPIALLSDPIPNVIYSWTGPLGFTSNLQNPILPNAKVGMAGVYSLNVIDSHCVSKTDTTMVIINPLPSSPQATTAPSDGLYCNGDSIQLYATFISGVTYQWSGPDGFLSSKQNPVIYNSAPVNSGKYEVAAVKNNCYSALSPVNVLVRKAPNTAPITGADSSFSGDVKTYQINGDSGSIFNWVSFGGVIQGANAGKQITVKWGNPGTGFVRARETNSEGCKGLLMQQNVIITKAPASGLNTQDLIHDIAAYPVPSDKSVTLKITSIHQTLATIQIFNITGESVFDKSIQLNQGTNLEELNTTSLADGMYLLRIYAGGESKELKLSIVH